MAEGHTLVAYLPGGASGGILPASKADVPLDFDTLQAHGSFIGSAAIIVLSEQDNLQAVATNLLAFFADESCGQCTPCRVGSEKMLSLLEQPTWDVQALTRLAQVMQDARFAAWGKRLQILYWGYSRISALRSPNSRLLSAMPLKGVHHDRFVHYCIG